MEKKTFMLFAIGMVISTSVEDIMNVTFENLTITGTLLTQQSAGDNSTTMGKTLFFKYL